MNSLNNTSINTNDNSHTVITFCLKKIRGNPCFESKIQRACVGTRSLSLITSVTLLVEFHEPTWFAILSSLNRIV